MGCEILSDSFGVYVQLMLGIAAMSSLWVKRMRERPRRPVVIWMMDVSKQAASGLLIHFWNVAVCPLPLHHLSQLSILLGSSSTFSSSDPCAWYFVNVVMDTTLGLLIIFALTLVSEACVLHFGAVSLRSGDYGTPPRISIFCKQLGVWIAIVWVSKIVLSGLMWAFALPFHTAARFVLSPLHETPHGELVVVMLIVPFCVNLVQFLLIDQLIKNHRIRSRVRCCPPPSPTRRDEEDTVPLREHWSGGDGIDGWSAVAEAATMVARNPRPDQDWLPAPDIGRRRLHIQNQTGWIARGPVPVDASILGRDIGDGS